MPKSVSITVHPSGLSGEYLTVSDAMRQVLDLVGALEEVEAGSEGGRTIVWRLVEAHTNSPPFTVTAEAFPKDPQVSIAIEAGRVLGLYSAAVSSLLEGEKPGWLPPEASKLFKRALRRNLNGVGHTDISVNDAPTVSIVPSRAMFAVEALERAEREENQDLSRIEFGSVEGSVIGLTKWYYSPALVFQERLSGAKIFCVLSADLAKQIGLEHNWLDAWDGRELRVSGEILYDAAGSIKRVNVSSIEEIIWANVPVHQLQEIKGYLEGKDIHSHINEFWGERFG